MTAIRLPARRLLTAAVVIVAAATSALPQKTSETLLVQDVRFWSLGEATRVAVETNGDFEFRYDRLPNPDRLFFDIQNAGTPIVEAGRIHPIPVGDNLLKQIRIAQTRPTVVRVVLDLEPGVDFSVSELANPSRLVIELRPVEARQPAIEPQTRPKQRSEPPAESPPGGISIEPAASSTEAAPVAVTQPAVASAPASLKKAAESAPAQSIRASERAAAARAVPPAAPPKTEVAKSVAPAAPVSAVMEKPEAPAPAREPAKTPAELEKSAPRVAKSNSDGHRSMTRVLGLKVGRVVLDPGHGGHDTGTIGRSGLMEKDLVLDIAKRVGALIEQNLGSEVFYTRTDDTFISLEARPEFANEKKADLFLSIHANSSRLRSVAGVETFYLNFTSSKADLEVASRENASSQKSVYELKDMIQKIAMQDKIDESREFATRVQNALHPVSVKSVAGAKNRGVKKAPFVVLIGTDMPAVLAEIGFVSNAREDSLLNRTEYRQRVAEALYKGIAQYAETLSHFQVAREKVEE